MRSRSAKQRSGTQQRGSTDAGGDSLCPSLLLCCVSPQARTHLTERFMAFCLHFELMKAAQLEPPIQIKPRE